SARSWANAPRPIDLWRFYRSAASSTGHPRRGSLPIRRNGPLDLKENLGAGGDKLRIQSWAPLLARPAVRSAYRHPDETSQRRPNSDDSPSRGVARKRTRPTIASALDPM